ncbi:MAG TPA: class I SAM-dependent methyltransferase [Chitinophagaceae bacterium]|jgi:2-polyprenyl-3-methyl-5-hydroxy-6-metoxy-1,4-benzoquinol methylase|nr:class I SAM-dependent methyltransferase [Chitinophagaceae bacterium]
MSSPGWDSFWKSHNRPFNEVMKISTTFFAAQIEKLFGLNPIHEVLDYGCGPGFLADYLTNKKIQITGVDINTSSIEHNKNNHPESLYFLITSDIEEDKSIFESHLKEKKFDFIILLSVVQYFKNTDELNKTIKMFLPYLKEDGKIILADVIDPSTSSANDAVSLFIHCVKKVKPFVFFRFIFYLLSSDYKRFSKNVKLLRLSEQSIHQIANVNLLNCKKVNGLTIHPTRTNYVLSKN